MNIKQPKEAFIMTSRGQLIKKLNQELQNQGINYETFVKWDQGKSYQGYLLGLIYSEYDYLCKVKNHAKNQSFAYPYSHSKIIGSINLQLLTELTSDLLNKSINPVYYLSSIFNHLNYQCDQGYKYKSPKIKNLIGDHKWFDQQVKYDQQYFTVGNTRKHQSILYRLNPVINLINDYFERVLKSPDIIQSYHDQYQAINLDNYQEMVTKNYFPHPYENLSKDIISAVESFNKNKGNYTNEELKRHCECLIRLYEGVIPASSSNIIINPEDLQSLATLMPNLTECLAGKLDPNITRALIKTNWGIAYKTSEITNVVSTPEEIIKLYWYTFTGYKQLLDLRTSFLQAIQLNVD